LSWSGVYKREPPFVTEATVTSSVMNLSISFKWRPYVDAGLKDLISWTSELDEPPHWLIMGVFSLICKCENKYLLFREGMTPWHIIFNRTSQKRSLSDFENTLREAVPILRKLSRRCKILWLKQLPVIENNAKWNADTINDYNLAATKILRSLNFEGAVRSRTNQIQF
jgi:hypothetical protein